VVVPQCTPIPYACATDYIPEIISQVQRLIEMNHAYETTDGIYFDIGSCPEYGKLSKQNLEELKVHRIEESETKRNQGDFVIWKKQKPGEPFWESPWGNGRPGWHVEDTAITEKEFGPQYDAHGGGLDLIFPHHEAEIALMESISKKKPFVRHWFHNGWVQVEGEKMSKSLGNYMTLRDALQKWSPETLRYYFLTTHYRAPFNFTEESVHAAENSREKIQTFYDDLLFIQEKVKNGETSLDTEKITQFTNAMDDDFNTSKALAVVFDYITEFYTKKQENAISKKDIQNALEFLSFIDTVFCILTKEQIPEEIQALANQREEARTNKDWAKADAARDALLEKGYIIDDTPQGPKVRKK